MSKGFSLLEISITLMILGLLAALLFPTYHHYILRARRVDGQMALFDLANRMEHYYFDHHSYQRATMATGKNTDITALSRSAEGWYDLSIIDKSATTYSLKATPRLAQTMDQRCQAFTLNHLGNQGLADGPQGGPTGSVKECWMNS